MRDHSILMGLALVFVSIPLVSGTVNIRDKGGLKLNGNPLLDTGEINSGGPITMNGNTIYLKKRATTQ